MPIYEYRCPDCRNLFSLRRRMSEADAPAACPTCQSAGSRRVISLFAAHGADGMVAGTGGGCASCAATSCGTCGSRH